MPDFLFSASSLPVLTNPLGIGDAKCGICGLWKTCKSPKMVPSGDGKKRICIVAEAPGKDEDAEGIQLVGKSGQKLSNTLFGLGLKMRRDCTLTNALICRPPGNIIKNRNAIDYCRPNLIKTLKELKPEVIVPLGQIALQSLLGWLWNERDVGGMSRWVGYQIPCQELNAWICPTWHPAYILREGDGSVPDIQFKQHLAETVKLEGRPWKETPEYVSRVEPIFSVHEAANRLQTIREGTIAFDYETNCLKPEYEGAKIYTCSVCYEGKWTIAFPWDGEAIDGMLKILRNPNIKKIASNMKFEDRWTRHILKTRIKGWRWDTMLTSHALENATKVRKISSIKFQAFVHLGQPDWSTKVKPYLESTKGHLNRIKELVKDKGGLRDLLEYNAMDSLIEYLIAQMQYERMGYA